MTLPLDELEEAMKLVSPKDIEIVNNSFHKVGDDDVVLGVLPPRIQQLWAISFTYAGAHDSHQHMALYKAETAEDKKLHEMMSWRFKAMAEWVKDLAWIEIRDTFGERAWDADSIGVRQGFQVVTSKAPEPKILFHGDSEVLNLQGLDLFRSALKRMMESREAEGETEEGKKRKPQ